MESEKMKIPTKVSIFGIDLSETDLEKCTDYLLNADLDYPSYVCFTCTPSIANTYNNNELKEILNNSIINIADGKLTEYYAALKGYRNLKNISGYWVLDKLLQSDKSHFFYGSDKNTLLKLKNKLDVKYPNAKILGYLDAPFVEASEIQYNIQIAKDINEIGLLNPDFIWVSMSHPKQEILMYHHKDRLNKGIMLGVGAVFLYHAEIVKKGPEILKKFALRWLYRFFQQPKQFIKRNYAFPGMLKFFKLIFIHDILKRKI